VREIRLLRSRWRGLETESRSGLHGHERGNPGHRQDHDLTDYRASPRPYRDALLPQNVDPEALRRPSILDVVRRSLTSYRIESHLNSKHGCWRMRSLRSERRILQIRRGRPGVGLPYSINSVSSRTITVRTDCRCTAQSRCTRFGGTSRSLPTHAVSQRTTPAGLFGRRRNRHLPNAQKRGLRISLLRMRLPCSP
jgi:hypothetical protein